MQLLLLLCWLLLKLPVSVMLLGLHRSCCFRCFCCCFDMHYPTLQHKAPDPPLRQEAAARCIAPSVT